MITSVYWATWRAGSTAVVPDKFIKLFRKKSFRKNRRKWNKLKFRWFSESKW